MLLRQSKRDGVIERQRTALGPPEVELRPDNFANSRFAGLTVPSPAAKRSARVLPSMSVKSNVTVPLGSSRTCARPKPCQQAFIGSDGDHDLSSGVSFAEVAQGVGRLAQLVASVDHRYHASGLEELSQDVEVFGRDLRDEEGDRLAPTL